MALPQAYIQLIKERNSLKKPKRASLPKPSMPPEILKILLQAFSVAGYDPQKSSDMMTYLAKASGKGKSEISQMYEDLYAQIEQDGSPFGPMPTILP
jgi:hypothetical protein